jgi:thioredoxin 1
MARERIRTIGNLILVFIGMAVLVYYLTCTDSCAYLQGDILGLDLKYIGFVFFAAMGVLVLLRQWPYLRALLAGALGAELFLVGFQIREGVYCPYCLTVAAIIVIAFIINYEKPEQVHGMSFLGMVRFPWPRNLGPVPLSLFVLAGLLFVWFTFSGSVLPAYGAEPETQVPVTGMVTMVDFGAKKCIPCKMMAPILEKLKKTYEGRASIVFFDVWEDPTPAKRFGVRGIPTQIFFDKHGEEVYRHMGYMSEEAIVTKLKFMGVN